MKKALFLILVFVSVCLIIVKLSTKPLLQFLNIEAKSGIRIESNPPAAVFINNQEVGKTSYQQEGLSVGDYLIELRSEKGSWKGYVHLNPGALSVVNREITENPSHASGEVITLEKGSGISIITSPPNADVEIDGKLVGQTPLLLADIEPGEHTFLLGKANFVKRSIRSVVTQGFRLNLMADLAISEADLTSVAAPVVTTTKQLLVKPTPTGFLRVRVSPNASSQEVARVRPGDKLELLEDLSSWKKVKLTTGKEGYVSSAYVEEGK